MASITSNFRMVKVASSIFPPFANSCAFLNRSNLNGKCPNPGLKLEYLRIIQEKGLLNFDLIQQTVVRGAGVLGNNLTWTGTLGQILHGSLDSIAPYVVVTPDRAQYFDFRFVYSR